MQHLRGFLRFEVLHPDVPVCSTCRRAHFTRARLVVRCGAGSASTLDRTQLFVAVVRMVASSVLKCASPTAVGGAGFRGCLVHGQDRGGFEDEPENANGPPRWDRAGRMR